ncbi:MAG: acyl carrier protein [Bacteroidales bacterium]|nr:acyl carrier protein [Bacteroidales bacterium]
MNKDTFDEKAVLEKVRALFSKYTDSQEIDANTVLSSELGLTSFDVVSLANDFEEEFDIEIPDRDIVGFTTVGDILAYLKAKQ